MKRSRALSCWTFRLHRTPLQRGRTWVTAVCFVAFGILFADSSVCYPRSGSPLVPEEARLLDVEKRNAFAVKSLSVLQIRHFRGLDWERYSYSDLLSTLGVRDFLNFRALEFVSKLSCSHLQMLLLSSWETDLSLVRECDYRRVQGWPCP